MINNPSSRNSNPFAKRLEGTSAKRNSRRSTGWAIKSRRNARRVPTAQRVRIFYRFFSYFCRWLGVAVIIACLFLVGRVMLNEFWKDKHKTFSLQKVTHSANPYFSTEELMKVAGLHYGMNLLSLDLKKIAFELEDTPQISWVRLRKKLPNTLHIEFRSPTPEAIVMLPEPYWVSKRGIPFKRAINIKKHWLRIYGVTQNEYANHPKEFARVFRQALALRNYYQKLGISSYSKLDEITIDSVMGYTLQVGKTTVHLNQNDLPKRLQKLAKVCRMLKKKKLSLVKDIHIDFERHTNWFVLKFHRYLTVVPGSASSGKLAARR